MPTPLTLSQFASVKFASVCSYEAYVRLHEWHYKVRNGKLPEQYVIPVTKSYYHNTTNRFYLSRWLESVITIYCNHNGWRVQKPYDKGALIKSKQGKEIWVKTRHSKAGEADLMVVILGKVYNVEIKVGADHQSTAQLKEQARAEANGEVYVIVKQLQDFWHLIDTI